MIRQAAKLKVAQLTKQDDENFERTLVEAKAQFLGILNEESRVDVECIHLITLVKSLSQYWIYIFAQWLSEQVSTSIYTVADMQPKNWRIHASVGSAKMTEKQLCFVVHILDAIEQHDTLVEVTVLTRSLCG
jgi:hypothetical protein